MSYSSTSSSVLVFGLGAMGLPIATRLLRAGHRVAGFDVDREARVRFAAAGGRDVAAEDLACVLPSCEAVITCVSDEAALEALWLGPASPLARDAAAPLIAALAAGQIVIDHTTTGIAMAVRLAARCDAVGASWVDAPLSGGVARAASGECVALAGGSETAVTAARTWLAAYCSDVIHLGGAGAGQAGKLSNQLAIAGTNLGLMAAAGFARAQGLDVERVLQAIGAGSGRSDQLAQHAHKLAAPDADFRAVFGWLEKDMRLASADAAACAFDREFDSEFDRDARRLVDQLAHVYTADPTHGH